MTCPHCGGPLVDCSRLLAVIESFAPALEALDRAGVGVCSVRYTTDPPSLTVELARAGKHVTDAQKRP